MEASTYILFSPSINRFYIGATSNLEARIIKHNAGYEKFTRKGTPWTLIWPTSKPSKNHAMILEYKLKNLNRKRLIATGYDQCADSRFAVISLKGPLYLCSGLSTGIRSMISATKKAW